MSNSERSVNRGDNRSGSENDKPKPKSKIPNLYEPGMGIQKFLENKKNETERVWYLEDNVQVQFQLWHEKWWVDFRKMWFDQRAKELKYSKKGIKLTLEQWREFNNVIENVDAAVKASCQGFSELIAGMPESDESVDSSDDSSGSADNEKELGRKKHLHINIREIYEYESGNLKFGKTHISGIINRTQKFEEFVNPRDDKNDFEDNKSKKKSSGVDAMGKESKKVIAEEPPVWKLGNDRFVEVCRSGNESLVNIIEMRCNDQGKFENTERGICLNMKQWGRFKEIREEINTAVMEEVDN